MGPLPRVHLKQSGTEEVVFSSQLLQLIPKEVDLGGTRPTAASLVPPAVMGSTDPSGDEKQGLNHEESVPGPVVEVASCGRRMEPIVDRFVIRSTRAACETDYELRT
jgi:hypothetical protein